MLSNRQSPHHSRPGYVLIAVLLVIVVLSLSAYRFAESMSMEYAVAVRASEAAQVRANAVSGIHYAMAALSDPDALQSVLGGSPHDNPNAFSNIAIGTQRPRGGSFFSVVKVDDSGSGSGEGRYSTRYGVEDEAGKININALIRLDPGGTVLAQVLGKLPNMTEDLVDAIVDWVDSDDDPRPYGAEWDSYDTYKPKNGPLSSLDELLLVRGMTTDLLYGSDRNRNGIMDGDEFEDGDFYRGLADFITIYGRELNVDSTGMPRIFLNEPDLVTLHQDLTDAIGETMANYVVAYRMFTTGTASGNSGGNSNQTGGPDQLRAAVQASLNGSPSPRRSIPNSILTLLNTQVTLPRAQDAPENAPTVVVPCPMNDEALFKELLPSLLDRTTSRSAYELNPRLNVNTAPSEVLVAAGDVAGVTQEDIDAALAIRENLTPGSPESLTGAWLVTQAGMRPEIFQQLERLITGSTQTYRIQSIGYFANGGPVARVEAVVDTNLGFPRIVYFRDLTDIGAGFTPPR